MLTIFLIRMSESIFILLKSVFITWYLKNKNEHTIMRTTNIKFRSDLFLFSKKSAIVLIPIITTIGINLIENVVNKNKVKTDIK